MGAVLAAPQYEPCVQCQSIAEPQTIQRLSKDYPTIAQRAYLWADDARGGLAVGVGAVRAGRAGERRGHAGDVAVGAHGAVRAFRGGAGPEDGAERADGAGLRGDGLAIAEVALCARDALAA